MKILGIVLFIVAYIVGVVLYNGYALSYFWNILVVPLLGLPVMSLLTALVVSSFVGYLTHKPDLEAAKSEDMSDKIAMALYPIFKPTALIFVGWMYSQFL